MGVQRAWLIDASIYIFRAWFSMPDRWYTRDGRPVQAVYGYTKFLLDFLDAVEERPRCAAAFDESLGSNFRNEIYPDYKSSREFPDEDLAFQLESCRAITELLGLPCYGGPRYEADDYLATLAKHCRQDSLAITVVTRDKDLGQLVLGGGDNWWDFAADERLDRTGIFEKFGVWPEQIGDYLALVGDSIDDIPGVPGVGPKTAAALLEAFGDIDNLKANCDSVAELALRGAGKLPAKLDDHWEQIHMARHLTGLEDSIARVKGVPRLELREGHVQDVMAFLRELDISGPVMRRCERLAEKLSAA